MIEVNKISENRIRIDISNKKDLLKIIDSWVLRNIDINLNKRIDAPTGYIIFMDSKDFKTIERDFNKLI